MMPTLIVTRPAKQGEEFARVMRDRFGDRVEIVLSPLIEIVPVPVNVDLEHLSGVIFTSVHAVNAVELPAGITAWCVGPRTAACATKAGFHAITGPGDAKALCDVIQKQAPCGPLAHIRGVHTRGEIARTLTKAGLPCGDVVAYEQQDLPLNSDALSVLKGEFPVVLPLFSPRTATIFSSQRPFVAPLHLVVMSNVVKKATGTVDAQTIAVASQPNGHSMIGATFARLDALLNNVS
ncbi:uroporphyrinogen-III synthase [Yoonia maritima]|uniref:uroporphyrinogen-III synthase n=1 Tax=Yoonia maritima TaxID=1435347 RepID=UPI000D0F32E5|nr:uroporphyrinogen-III synthase [Yoonia maritima]